MACVILRAAARVSSSAASVAYRFAKKAAAAAAARSDPLEHSSYVVGSFHPPVAAAWPWPPRSCSRLSHGSTVAKLQAAGMDGSPFANIKRGCAKFEANDKDLESDDALWDLYERWCKFFNQERDRQEMARRFSYFKETVLRVEENKKSHLPYRLGINMFADGKLRELYLESRSKYYYVRRRRPCSSAASPIYGSQVGFEEDPAAAANKGTGHRN